MDRTFFPLFPSHHCCSSAEIASKGGLKRRINNVTDPDTNGEDSDSPEDSEIDSEEEEERYYALIDQLRLQLVQPFIEYHNQVNQLVLSAASLAGQVEINAASPTVPRPYHTSALSGYAWILELLEGHPGRIQCELGVHCHVFLQLINILEDAGYRGTQSVMIEDLCQTS
ncbi:hypothetical protein BJ138DRAFT_1118224 [Hygrophoropsis aurantiaca]|uniref:Uncharacterized protein n=1 Tax=Hygrophoropsis aurantiaca TaxID=72124 RepID=A0ACB7ZX98_9AGAM|nr:hypothetical protein BJ138DRAFT_1118224 [Hygrophoropsis aurantiaca]